MNARNFSARMKELRESAGLTQRELADKINTTVRNISRLETGVQEPTWPTVVAIALALGVSCEAFLQAPAKRAVTGRGRPRKHSGATEPASPALTGGLIHQPTPEKPERGRKAAGEGKQQRSGGDVSQAPLWWGLLLEPLVQALGNLDDDRITQGLMQAFGSLRDTGEAEPLIRAFGNLGDGWVIESVIRAMGCRNFAPLAVGERREEQAQDAGWVREAAAWALARFRGSQALDLLRQVFAKLCDIKVIVPLIRSLEDVDERVREQAAWALDELSAALLRALVNQEDRVRAAAARTLVALLHKAQEVREAVAQRLEKVSGREGVEPPLDYLRDRNSEVREAVARVLGCLRDRSALKPLIRVLEDPFEFVRRAATEALGRLGDPRAVAPLMQRLEADELLHGDAAKALGQLGELAVEPLVRALKFQRWQARQAAANVLGELHDGRAVKPLIQKLEAPNEDVWVRVAAAQALGKLGDPRAVEPLIQALENPDTMVLEAAIEALGDLRDRRAVPALRRLADNVASYDRAAGLIEDALQKIEGESSPNIPARDARAD
jgi:HEAT repeat protein/transcriptional regulator with XRE-family HTH domain